MNRTALAVSLALAAAAAPGCGLKDEKPASPAPGAAGSRAYMVSVQPVESRALSYAVEAVGTLEAYDVLAVPARVAGVLESLSFDEGDQVKADQELAVVDGKRYAIDLDQQRATVGRTEASVESAKARTSQADAALKEAETALARRRGLREKNPGWVTEDELSSLEAAVSRTRASLAEAQAGVKVAAAQVEEARTNVSIAAKNAEDARVRSPIAGTIERRQASPGQYVRPGDPIATLVDVSRLRVRFRVSEAESVKIHVSQRVEVRVAAYPERSFGAEVFHVNATADPTTRMVECLASMKDPEKGLKPGFFASVRAVVAESADALVVPVAAVLPTERGFTCFVIEDGKARERRLTLGLHTKDEGVEVIAGLRKGETLAVEGAGSLQEGVPVEVVTASVPPKAPAAPPKERAR
jgi:RND family efflux transporter MFP subunit